ncbi:MAG: DNA polymerase III subunit alpha [Saprospiraceae bacterium]|nr:DNA polymerase III subunit alpha [Saprospiraceae bacterium]
MPEFSHLHCHSQFSLLDGAASIKGMFKKASESGMNAIALTDHGNMFGAFEFVAEAAKYKNKVKPIVGCEFYLVDDRHKRQFSKEQRDKRYHQLFLAKNAEGYANLTKMCSLGYIEGLYGKYPRIDKELVLQYHKGLIATTCCIGAEVPQTILKHGEEAARKVFEWWFNIFGEDYYIELQRHDMPEQNKVNEVLLKFAIEYNVKTICTNDSHYLEQKDSNAHDILLCINTGEKQSTPTNKSFSDDASSTKGTRFAFWNDQFYFKTPQEMANLFPEHHESLDNTQEIVDKVDLLNLKQDILLPNFVIPQEFHDQDEYLKHITLIGAKNRYKEITPEIEERLNFELHTVKTMGFAGYFLIVSDFIQAGKEIGVFVGPGRGSAAGSAIAYCIGITNIDPIKYNLLFERFLNPDRKSMPDIDTDFDDEGRQKVIDYVVKKYGKQQVAQIVTFGTMAAKMSIKDVARVLDLPLQESNMLAKLVPDKPGITLRRVLTAPITGDDSLKEKEALQQEDIENCKKLRDYLENDELSHAKVLKEALILEGSVRNTGIHAAGIIIAPKDLTDIIPVFTSKETELLITQFEGSIIEDAGVIKMDFLGLKNLTIIRDALELIKNNHNITINLDEIPLDDAQTYDLYQRGETNGTFQFESVGMQKYLRDLKPDKFEDLIAMNALYRPGPIAYIPNFIARKHGREAVSYDLEEMKEFLEETYGITVYQEQVMLLSQKLANFSKGDADTLRKAMGKKQKNVLDKMKGQFMEGCASNGHDLTICEKIWTDWEAFASYAFNKSHSTCYAFIAFQTGYLKSHYPAEYLAAILKNNQGDIKKITFFLNECKRMNISVKGPDINESFIHFSVNKKGEIRYGLGAIKGVGEAAVESIIEERSKNGYFIDIFDLIKRINLRTVNKKVLESLAAAGAFDFSDKMHRAQYFVASEKYPSFIEHLIKFGSAVQTQNESVSTSLFGNDFAKSISDPVIPFCEPWSLIQKLNKERDVTGMYLSGHPLDDYKVAVEALSTITLEELESKNTETKVRICVFVSDVNHRISKKGTGFGNFVVQDYTSDYTITLFTDDYQKYKSWFEPGQCLCIQGNLMKRRYEEDHFELKITDVRLLATAKDEFFESIFLRVHLAQVNKMFIHDLNELFNQHKGGYPYVLDIIDVDEQNIVHFVSKFPCVDINDDLINNITDLGIEYRINTK